ncbi:MAG: hypothetical protein ACK4N5_27335, partial [Myxococcales bacterium]
MSYHPSGSPPTSRPGSGNTQRARQENVSRARSAVGSTSSAGGRPFFAREDVELHRGEPRQPARRPEQRLAAEPVREFGAEV